MTYKNQLKFVYLVFKGIALILRILHSLTRDGNSHYKDINFYIDETEEFVENIK